MKHRERRVVRDRRHEFSWPRYFSPGMSAKTAPSLSAIDLALDAKIAEELTYDAICNASCESGWPRTRAKHRAMHFARTGALCWLLAWLAFWSIPGCAISAEHRSYCERARDLGCEWAESCVEPGMSRCEVRDPDACLDALEELSTCDLEIFEACAEVCE